MNLTDADIGEFQVLWKEETGEDISVETARQYATSILGLVSIVVQRNHPREEKPP